MRTFGIDRIVALKIGVDTTLKVADFEEQLAQFHKIVDLDFNDGNGKIIQIKLRVYHKHLKYLKSLSLHHTQKIDWEQGEAYGMVTYQLIPNYEFKVQGLKMGTLFKYWIMP